MICGEKVVKQDKDQFDPSTADTKVSATRLSGEPMIDLLSGEDEQPKAVAGEEKWEASFSTEACPSDATAFPAATPAAGSPSAGEGVDLFGAADTVKTAKRKSLVGSPSAECDSKDLDVLELDFSQTTAEPNEAAPTLPSAHVGDKKDTPEDSSAPLGERLREAVLSGSEEDIMKLFQQAPKPKVVEVVDPSRSAKFAGLQDDELNAFFTGASTHAEQESTSASDSASVSTSEEPPRDATQVPESSVASSDGESPAVAQFFIGDDEEDAAKKSESSSIPSFTPEVETQQLSAQQLSRLFAQQNPQVPNSLPTATDLQAQLSGMGPHQLQEMQSIINQMLQQKGVSATAPPQQRPQQPPARKLSMEEMMQQKSGSPQVGGYPSGCSAKKDAQIAPQFDFGDPAQLDQLFGGPDQVNQEVEDRPDVLELNQAFVDSKPKVATSTPNKPIWRNGDGVSATSSGAMANIGKYCEPGYVKQETSISDPEKKPFGDLLSAFQEKNLLAGMPR